MANTAEVLMADAADEGIHATSSEYKGRSCSHVSCCLTKPLFAHGSGLASASLARLDVMVYVR